MKSFRPKDEKPEDREPPDPGNPTVDFHGEKRSNATHESTDPEAKLARKSNGQRAKLSYSLNGLTENKNGLLVAMALEQATGTAERDAAVGMLFALGATKRIPLGADKGYDTKGFIADCRELIVTAHVAEHRQAQKIGHRCAHHFAAGLRGKPTETEAHRRGVGVDEVGSGVSEVAVCGAGADSNGRLPRRCRVQPAPHRQAASRLKSRACGSGPHAHSRKRDKNARQTSLLNTLLDTHKCERGDLLLHGELITQLATSPTSPPTTSSASRASPKPSPQLLSRLISLPAAPPRRRGRKVNPSQEQPKPTESRQLQLDDRGPEGPVSTHRC